MLDRTIFGEEHELARDQVRHLPEEEFMPHHTGRETDGILERAVIEPRHGEIQLCGDQHGPNGALAAFNLGARRLLDRWQGACDSFAAAQDDRAPALLTLARDLRLVQGIARSIAESRQLHAGATVLLPKESRENTVSLNAQVDAARAVELVGWSDRTLLKSALGTTLAKTTPDRALFDEAFDRFFRFSSFENMATQGSPAWPSLKTDANPVSDAVAAQDLPEPAYDKQTATGSGGPGGCQGSGGQALSQLLLSGDSAALVKRMQEAARKVGLTDIWFFTQKGYYTQKIQQAMGLELLDREISAVKRQTLPPERAEDLERARKKLFEEVRNFVERKLALHGTARTRQLHDDFLQSQKLSSIDKRDFARMHAIVGKIAKRLADRHSRRKKKRVRGQLDFRKALRKNAAYDGVMCETFWRSKVVDRPRVVAIRDVSGSVRRYAHFLLLFLHSLGEQVSDLRSFAFTGHLVEVSDTFESLPVEQAVDEVMQAVGGSGTDYGQTLLDDIDRRTTVLILGDSRNNRGQAQAHVMQLLYQRARRVIWLNPEPVSFWGLGNSEMRRYAPYCHIARECNSLAHLESTLDALLRTHSASA